MSLLSVFDIAGTGISAQGIRMNITASNLANAQTVGSSPETTYRAKQPIFSTLLEGEFGSKTFAGGVKVDGLTESKAEPKQVFQPEHPMANEEGYIYFPNVNVMEEMANMISTSRTYQANVQAANMAKTLLLSTLSLGR